MKYHDTFSHVVQLVTIPSKTKKLKTSQILSFTSGPEGASELRVRRARFKSASASVTRTSGKETTDQSSWHARLAQDLFQPQCIPLI